MIALTDVGLILLAAGSSSRLGQPKQLLPFRGQSLLRHAASTAACSKCSPLLAVLGFEHERMRHELTGLPIRAVVNPSWQEGIGESLRCGLEAVGQDVGAVVVMLCDQPLLTTQILNELVEKYRSLESPIVACEYGGTLGVPALFDKSMFPELLGVSPAEGARRIIQRHSKLAVRVGFPGGEFDIDLAADLPGLDEP